MAEQKTSKKYQQTVPPLPDIQVIKDYKPTTPKSSATPFKPEL
jgi:hypothetical protein